jgi:hypothetical protein
MSSYTINNTLVGTPHNRNNPLPHNGLLTYVSVETSNNPLPVNGSLTYVFVETNAKSFPYKGLR